MKPAEEVARELLTRVQVLTTSLSAIQLSRLHPLIAAAITAARTEAEAAGYARGAREERERAAPELERLRKLATTIAEHYECVSDCADMQAEEDDDYVEPGNPATCPCCGDECLRCAAAQAMTPSKFRVDAIASGEKP